LHVCRVSVVETAFALVFWIAFVSAFLVFGLFACWVGFRWLYAGGQTLAGALHSSVTDPVSPGEAPDSGHAVVTGTVSPGPGGTVLTPFSGTEAVACRYAMNQESDSVGWWTVLDNGVGAPFVLEGNSDRILVNPADAVPDVETAPVEVVAADGTLSPDTAAALARSPAVDAESRPQTLAEAVDEPRRYADSGIEPGDTLFVYGAITEDTAHGRRIDAASSREFRLTRTVPSFDEVDATSALKYVVGGLFALALGTVFVVISGGLALEIIRGVTGA
jgi:hypothetical protein